MLSPSTKPPKHPPTPASLLRSGHRLPDAANIVRQRFERQCPRMWGRTAAARAVWSSSWLPSAIESLANSPSFFAPATPATDTKTSAIISASGNLRCLTAPEHAAQGLLGAIDVDP